MFSRDEIFQYTNEYTEFPEYTKSIQINLRSLQSIPNDVSEYTKSIRKVDDSIRFHGIFDSYIISFQPSTFPLPDL